MAMKRSGTRPRTDKGDGELAAASVRAYLAALAPAARGRMQKIRAIVRAATPGAIEHFSYGIPGFRLAGQALVWYAAFRQHISLYPMTPTLLRVHRIDVSRYETSKGTVRLPLDQPLPVPLVKRLVKARAAEVRKTNVAKRLTIGR